MSGNNGTAPPQFPPCRWCGVTTRRKGPDGRIVCGGVGHAIPSDEPAGMRGQRAAPRDRETGPPPEQEPKVASNAEDDQPGKDGNLRNTWQSSGRRLLKDVKREQVRWLWPGRIPLGKITVIDGDPGLGKSMTTLDLAARVSIGGVMPDDSLSDLEGPAGVVLLSAEDGAGDTIRPRLEEAGADLALILVRETVDDDAGKRWANLADLAVLVRDITEVGARLVIIDPLMAYLPSDTNAHRDQDIRRLLAPLAKLAERTGAAILVVRHLNKAQGGNALYRGGGSIGIVGAARSGLVVARDPDDPEGARRIIAVTKSNLSIEVPAIAYRVESGPGGAPHIVWGGTTNHTASSLLIDTGGDDEERSALDDAKDFLKSVLTVGACLYSDIQKEAKAAGISDRTLYRAKAALRVTSKKQKFENGRWTWEMPSTEESSKVANESEGCQPEEGGNVRESWQPSEDGEVEERCPSCGRPLAEGGACFSCEYRLCATCGEETGAALRGRCNACAMRATTGATP